MLYTIYQVTHKESGKVYIGKHQTSNLEDGYMGSGQLIRCAVKKYGVDAFDKEVLHVFETEIEMNAKEAELVTEEFCLREDTYNLCPGGNGGWGYVNTQLPNGMLGKSQSAKQRAAASIQGKKNQIVRAKSGYQNGLKDYWLGKRHSEETKEKLSRSAKLRTTNSQSGTMWITNGSENAKIAKGAAIPEGWGAGRKITHRQLNGVEHPALTRGIRVQISVGVPIYGCVTTAANGSDF